MPTLSDWTIMWHYKDNSFGGSRDKNIDCMTFQKQIFRHGLEKPIPVSNFASNYLRPKCNEGSTCIVRRHRWYTKFVQIFKTHKLQVIVCDANNAQRISMTFCQFCKRNAMLNLSLKCCCHWNFRILSNRLVITKSRQINVRHVVIPAAHSYA